MARIRTIKPEFWTDGALIECSMSARLLFIGTWNFADDQGNLDRSAKQIKARVFPADNIDCEPLLRELMAQRLLTEYSVNGKKYIHIQGFTKHQLINRPSKPTCPAFDDSLSTQAPLTEYSQQEGKGREGKGGEGKETPTRKRAEPSIPRPDEVTEQVWSDWLAVRKAKKHPMPTETALKGIRREFQKAGMSLQTGLEMCCAQSWSGFKASWLDKDTGETTYQKSMRERMEEFSPSIAAKRPGASEAKPMTMEILDAIIAEQKRIA